MTLKTWLGTLLPELYQKSERQHWLQYGTFTDLFYKAQAGPPFVNLITVALGVTNNYHAVDWLLGQLAQLPDLDPRLAKVIETYQAYRKRTGSVTVRITLFEAHLDAWRVFKDVVDGEQTRDRAWRDAGCPRNGVDWANVKLGNQTRAVKACLDVLVESSNDLSHAVLYMAASIRAEQTNDQPFYEHMTQWLRDSFVPANDCTLRLKAK